MSEPGTEAPSRRLLGARLTQAECDDIVRRHEAGESCREIGLALNMSSSNVRKVLNRGGIAMPFGAHCRKLTDEEEVELEARYRGGWTMRNLATTYGIHERTASAIINRVRRNRGAAAAIPAIPVALPTNVIPLTARPTPIAPPKATISADAMRTQTRAWLREVGRVEDLFGGLVARCGDDALAAVLAASEEGRLTVDTLERLAGVFLAFAEQIRQRGAGQEDRRHGSTTR